MTKTEVFILLVGVAMFGVAIGYSLPQPSPTDQSKQIADLQAQISEKNDIIAYKESLISKMIDNAAETAVKPPDTTIPEPDSKIEITTTTNISKVAHYDMSSKEIACSSDYAVNEIKSQIIDPNNPALDFSKHDYDSLKIDLDNVTTLGKTFHGYVCDALVTSYKKHDDAKTVEDSDEVETLEIYYRVDLNDTGKDISVEIIDKNVAMTAR